MSAQASTNHNGQALDPLLAIREVSDVVKLQKSAIHARIAAGTFPPGILLSARCRRWKTSSVRAWLESL
jgi:predicted DNA-binding transcriptional regulator AlpA